MISRLNLILLAETLLTLALLTTLLLAPGPVRVAPGAAKPSSPSTTEVSQARVAHSKVVVAKAAPAKGPAAKATATAPAPVSSQPAATAPPASEPAAPLVAVAALPETGGDYRKARRQLLARGFKPANTAPEECRGPEPSVDACWGALVQFPEIETCSNGSRGFCIGWWLAPDGRVLKIKTVGDAGRISDRHWASAGEIADLPRGWRP
jgi:hypothetical protein